MRFIGVVKNIICRDGICRILSSASGRRYAAACARRRRRDYPARRFPAAADNNNKPFPPGYFPCRFLFPFYSVLISPLFHLYSDFIRARSNGGRNPSAQGRQPQMIPIPQIKLRGHLPNAEHCV
jgi:hypothetical protein